MLATTEADDVDIKALKATEDGVSFNAWSWDAGVAADDMNPSTVEGAVDALASLMSAVKMTSAVAAIASAAMVAY